MDTIRSWLGSKSFIYMYLAEHQKRSVLCHYNYKNGNLQMKIGFVFIGTAWTSSEPSVIWKKQ